MKGRIPLPKGGEDKNIEIGLYPACSAGDCTGLIPKGVRDEDELESYKDMYNYTAPDKKHI